MSRGSALVVVALALSLSLVPAFAMPLCGMGHHQSCPHRCPMPDPSTSAATLADKPCSTSCCNPSSAKIIEAAAVAPTSSPITVIVLSRPLPGSEQEQINKTHWHAVPPKSCQQAVLCTFLV